MRIALDFDGVIADIGEAICSIVIELTGRQLAPQQLRCWGLIEALGVSREIEAEVTRRCFVGFDGLHPYPEALAAVQALRKEGHTLVVATSREDKRGVAQWLSKYGFFSGGVHALGAGDAMPSVDVLLDDYPTKLLSLRPFVKQKLFLFERPWNTSCLNLEGLFERVSSWRDFRYQLGRIKGDGSPS